MPLMERDGKDLNNSRGLTRSCKTMDNSVLNTTSTSILSTSALFNSSLQNLSACQANISMSKTPSKTPRKTPGKHNRSHKNPSKQTTPLGRNGGDRFIPNRHKMQFELANYVLTNQENINENTNNPEYRAALEGQLNTDLANFRIMAYSDKAPPAPEGHGGNKVLYSASKQIPSAKKNARFIPKTAERILDCPDIRDDFYLNLMDWSSTNLLVVCLRGQVYTWNASSGEVDQLLELSSPSEYVCSASWCADGSYLALGTSDSQVHLWDIRQRKRLRVLTGHASRVCSLAWNGHTLSSGARSGFVHHHDVRVAQHHVGTLSAHQQEVCGLRWAPDGRMLASGGNDNLLRVWPSTMSHGAVEPLHSFTEHQAAVKAIAWCPWQSSVLASGGGTADRCIRFWSCNMGTQLNSIDTGSQVSSILWSNEHKEIISGHGFSKHELSIWKYPSMRKMAELTGHTARVLCMCLSPDGSMVASAGADETLRIWNCFAVDPAKKKQQKLRMDSTASTIFRQSIR
ncbi:cell division cycle protein 20 homolog [Dermacentor silvarum]|uniref:cell division cycle protein 20 homolog n=1 Tax=Dermacentor silvarum TaxID=543639 RepID=UPI00189BB686|nr:cell division cycle protein 20 homolog [Dermacentor silvarum]